VLTKKVLRGDGPLGDALDGTHVGRRGKSDPASIVPHGLLVADVGQLGELLRGQPVLTDVIVEEHGHTVTNLGTTVNTLFADKRHRIGYRLLTMKYPNKLAELMANHPGGRLTDSAVAKLVSEISGHRTSKQQINKLKLGQRKLDREWAERLGPIFGKSWPEMMGWSGELPAPEPDPTPTYKAAGARIAWARNYRQIPNAAEAARRFAMSIPRLRAIEAGEAELTIMELATISAKLQISTDFLLRGSSEDLPHRVAEDWEAYLRDLRSDFPMSKG
jgi:hypothetical protein